MPRFVRARACTRLARCRRRGCARTRCLPRARRADALRAAPGALASTLPALSSSATSRIAVDSNVSSPSPPSRRPRPRSSRRRRRTRRPRWSYPDRRGRLRERVVGLEAVVVAERRRRAGAGGLEARHGVRRCGARGRSRRALSGPGAPRGPRAGGPGAPAGPGGPAGRFHERALVRLQTASPATTRSAARAPACRPSSRGSRRAPPACRRG